MTKFFNKFKKNSRTTSYGFLAPCQKLEKTNDTIPRKCSDRQKDRRKDGRKNGQTPFPRTLPVTARSPKRLYILE